MYKHNNTTAVHKGKARVRGTYTSDVQNECRTAYRTVLPVVINAEVST